MPVNWTMTITLGNVLTIVAILGAVAFLYRSVARPVMIFLHEHDLMWDDYSKRHGLPYRVRWGRTTDEKPPLEVSIKP